MNLSDYMELKKKNIISIVGAGGKTTMMFKLAEELRKNNKVLVTTTTKIYVPSSNQYDFICTDREALLKYCNMKNKGIYVLGLGVNEDNKILGLTEKELDELEGHFDYILIEADGSKKKQLKGWNEFEPVIYRKTTKTIGIIDIQSYNIQICENNIHRSKLFCEITGAKDGDDVKLEHLLNLVTNPSGLFKVAQGRKILYINKVEGAKYLTLAKALVKEIGSNNRTLVDNIIFGSLKNNTYDEAKNI